MPFEIRKPKPPATYVSDRRLNLAEDKQTVVEENDPRGRTLLVGKEASILVEEAEYYGLTMEDGKFVTKEQAAQHEGGAP